MSVYNLVADLPTEFDIVIAGTGLTETILAAAFSRIGLKVLHLDRNDSYGGAFANFNLEALETWKHKNQKVEAARESSPASENISQVLTLLKDGQQAVALPPESARAFNIKSQFYVRERTQEEEEAAQVQKLQTKLSFFHNVSPAVASDQSSNNSAPIEAVQDTDPGLLKTEELTQVQVLAGETPVVTERLLLDRCDDIVSGNLSDACKITPTIGSTDPESGQKCPRQVCPLIETAGEVLSGQDNTTPGESVVAVEPGQVSGQQPCQWTAGDIQDDWRRFCFDLSPKVLFCNGEMIELLIRSDVARYCEFRTVSRVLTVINNILQQVPCSRADVFSSKIVSLLEKRLMMKFLQFAADFEQHSVEYTDFIGKPFVDFLKSQNLTPNIQHFVQHAIAMVSNNATTEEGLKNTQVFLRSLGRYGNTAFLYPLYGTGELPQAFARLSAVFGGIYCLDMSPTHVITDSHNQCCGIVTSSGQLIRCRYFIAEESYLPPSFTTTSSRCQTARAIYITDRSILPSVDSELSLLNFSSRDNPSKPVFLLELPPSACVCPQNLFVVHLTREAVSENPEDSFVEVRHQLFATDCLDETRKVPRILWSIYFTQEDKSQVSLSDLAVGHVLVTSGGGAAGVDLDHYVREARTIFKTVCPEEEFLPKPPNPEDIIHVDETETQVTGGHSEFLTSEITSAGGDSQLQTNAVNTEDDKDLPGRPSVEKVEDKDLPGGPSVEEVKAKDLPVGPSVE